MRPKGRSTMVFSANPYGKKEQVEIDMHVQVKGTSM